MKRRLLYFMTVMCLWLMCCGFTNETQHVLDDAELYTRMEEEKLEEALRDASDECDVDLLILTLDGIPGREDPYEFMGDYIDDNGWGSGKERYTCLMMIDMDDRTVYIYEWTDNIRKYHIYLQSELDDIRDNVLDDLSDGDYMRAAEKFIKYAEKHSDEDEAPFEAFQYGAGNRYDLDGKRRTNWGYIGISALVALGCGGLAVFLAWSKNRSSTVKNAKVYANKDKFHVYKKYDRYSHTTTTRTKIESSSGGGGGGGNGGGGHGSSGHF